MDQVDTLHVGGYWSEVLCYTTMTHQGDIEVKVTDLDILIDLVAKHKSGELRCPATALIRLHVPHSTISLSIFSIFVWPCSLQVFYSVFKCSFTQSMIKMRRKLTLCARK